MAKDTPDNMDEAKGRGKKALGDLTGNKKMKQEGQKDETAGKVKSTFNKAVDKVTRKGK